MSISRRSIIRSSVFAAPRLFSEIALPVPAMADVPNADPNQWFWFPGHSFCMKATGKDTGGTSGWQRMGRSKVCAVPQAQNEDESFLVIGGTFEISVGDKTITGGPGTYAFGRRGIPHRWTNVGEERGRIMNVFTPSGFEAMFYEIGLPIPNSADAPAQNPAPLIARMPALAEKYGNTNTGDFQIPAAPSKGLTESVDTPYQKSTYQRRIADGD